MPATSVNGQVARRLDVFPRFDHVNVRLDIVYWRATQIILILSHSYKIFQIG